VPLKLATAVVLKPEKLPVVRQQDQLFRKVGTAGGIVADEHGRAIAEDGQVIPGLYVTGNSSAAVAGRCYPGAGASVGPAMVFGYIAARHAAGMNAI
jgi:3-oxosteroid 1-dehydrogenase